MSDKAYFYKELGNISGLKSYGILKTPYTSQLPFYVSCVGEYKCDRHFYVDRSGYNTCLLIYTLSGEGLLRYGGTEYSLNAGQIAVINCNHPQYYATKSADWHFLWFHIDGKCIFDYVDRLNERGHIPLHLGNRISFQEYYDKILAYKDNVNPFDELKVSVMIEKLISDMIQLKNSDVSHAVCTTNRESIEELIKYLHTHFKDSVTVEQMADMCCLSKYYFMKIFKYHTGSSPYDYLICLRLQYAQELLLQTDRSVAAIAHDSGFFDSKGFIYNFKKHFNMTPLQFKIQNSLCYKKQ